MAGREIKHDSTSQSVWLRAFSAVTGQPKTDLAYNSSGISLWYQRVRPVLGAGMKVSITPAALASVSATWSEGGFIHVGDGYCRLDPPDAAFVATATAVLFGGTADDTLLIGVEHPLVANIAADLYARMGTPAGDSLAADIAAMSPSVLSQFLASSIPTGQVMEQDIELYVGEARTFVWDITDSITGNAVDLTGIDVRLTVETDCGTDFINAISLSGAAISEGETEGVNNRVTISIDELSNTTVGGYHYALWDTTNKKVLARGDYVILEGVDMG